MDFGLDYTTTESVFEGGPSAGFDESGSFGGAIGISYRAVANTGTVTAVSNGALRAAYPDVIDEGTKAAVSLQYLPDTSGGSLDSTLGAAVTVTGRVAFCAIPIPFGECTPGTQIDLDFDLLDEGFVVEPSTTFTPFLDVPRTASDVDNALGVGPNLDLIIGELGAEVNVDVAQSITFTPTGLDGLLRYENRDTSEAGVLPFNIASASGVQLMTEALGIGVWDFEMLNVVLENDFRNDVNLDIRPTINYVLGEWPPPGSPLFSVGLVDESFDLTFAPVSVVDAFTIEVIPEPGTALLVGLGLAALGAGRGGRRRALQLRSRVS